MGHCKTCNAEFLGNAKIYCLDCSYEIAKVTHKLNQRKRIRKLREQRVIK